MPDSAQQPPQLASAKTQAKIASVPDEDPTLLPPDELSETIKNEKPTHNNFTAFAPKPQKVVFDSQLRNEEIVLLLRQHPITQFSKLLIICFGILFPILLFASPFLSFLPFNYKVATVIGWYLILSGFAFQSFLAWYFRVFIITNRRVIDVDFYSIVIHFL